MRRKSSHIIVRAMFISTFLLLSTSCDPEGKKDCAWVLEGEPNYLARTEPGYIPVCARNRNTNKQDCRLQATLEFAKKTQGKKFRYVDMSIDGPSIPRTIKNIEFCQ